MNRFGNILHRLSIATALAVALSLLAAVSVPPGAMAQTSAEAARKQVYTVHDVAVDVTAENAAKAREQALAEGQVKALQQLMRRLTPASHHGGLPVPTPGEAESVVLGISPTDEKTSSVRYLADLTISFVPQSVQQYLESQDVAFVDQPAPAMVVVPVWKPAPDAEAVLWEDPNPWRVAWSNRTPGGLVPLEVPYGDLEDVAALPAPQAMAMSQQGLNTLASRYGAERALVATAVLQPGPEPVVDVRATRTDLGGETYSARVPIGEGEALADVLSRAVAEIGAQVENAYTSRAVLLSGPASGQLTAIVPIATLDEWLALRRQIEQAQVVREVSLQALTKDRAQVTVMFAGGPEQLAQALARQDLALEDSTGYWVIRKGAPNVMPTFAPPPTQVQRSLQPPPVQSPQLAPQLQRPPLPSITQPLRPVGMAGQPVQ